MSKLDWRRARTYREREAINDPHPGRLERRADAYLKACEKRIADKAKREAVTIPAKQRIAPKHGAHAKGSRFDEGRCARHGRGTAHQRHAPSDRSRARLSVSSRPSWSVSQGRPCRRVSGTISPGAGDDSPLASCSKTAGASFHGFSELLDRDAGGDRVLVIDDRELFSVLAALEIERVLRGNVDVYDPTWF